MSYLTRPRVHQYGGVEHTQPGPFPDCLLCQLDEARGQVRELQEKCPTCGHEWRRHDPEDGRCDAHSDEPGQLGSCRCGREVEFTAARNAELSREAPGGGYRND